MTTPLISRAFEPNDSATISRMTFVMSDWNKPGTMRVWFHSNPNALYEYSNVTFELWNTLITSLSVGAAFASSVKRDPQQYPFKKKEF
jgi:hypothetical protein